MTVLPSIHLCHRARTQSNIRTRADMPTAVPQQPKEQIRTCPAMPSFFTTNRVTSSAAATHCQRQAWTACGAVPWTRSHGPCARFPAQQRALPYTREGSHGRSCAKQDRPRLPP
jgi:hypothetical protein